MLTPDLRAISFSRRNVDEAEIWGARRDASSGRFEAPTRLDELATAASELPVWVSSDTCRLHLASNVSGEYDLFVTERR